MPLVYIKNAENCSKIAVWKKAESVKELESILILDGYEENYYNKISNENRKQEWLITRVLLTEMLGKKVTIRHNINGRPYIKDNSLQISISHSKNFVAIITSQTHNLGIDIEHISERAFKIKHKFLNTIELRNTLNTKQITATWAAKEAIFKIYETALDFKNILIDNVDVNNDKGIFKAKVISPNGTKYFLLNYMLIENDILVYSFEE